MELYVGIDVSLQDSSVCIVETKSARAPAAAKYRHPENPALTWSGRGRKPQWFVEALSAGKTATDLAMN